MSEETVIPTAFKEVPVASPYTPDEWTERTKGQQPWDTERLIATVAMFSEQAMSARVEAAKSNTLLAVLCVRQGGSIAFSSSQLQSIPQTSRLEILEHQGGFAIRVKIPRPAIVLPFGPVNGTAPHG